MPQPTPMANRPKEWPKYPNPKDGGAAKGWDWKKKESIPKQRLELALEALSELFANDAGLSGMSLRQLSEQHRKALDTFQESFDAPEKPALQIRQQSDCWSAIQMASQEIYLQKNGVRTDGIAYQHRWRMADLLNNEAKLLKIKQYLGADKVKDTGYPSDRYLANLLEEQKDKGAAPEKIITLKDLIDSLKANEFTVIMGMSPGTIIDMVRQEELPKEDVEELRAAIEGIQRWFDKELKVILELIMVATK
jgi:hypothetical protein